MKPFDWNEQKNALLKVSRGVGFEDVVNAIADGHLLIILQHPNPTKYPNQKVYVIRIQDYAYAVPFIENKDALFLKTIYPSRKFTKQFLSEQKES